MARINLLPWRVERRKQRQQEFYVMLGVAALAAVVLSFFIIAYYSGQISGQNDRNAYLHGEIAKVDQQIKQIEELDKKKSELLARKQVIEQLQANRFQMVHLFDSLVRTIPDGVILTSIKQEGELLTLEGRSQSNARVSTYLRNLESSGWMTHPELSVIEAKDDPNAGKDVKTIANAAALPYAFTLQVTLANPNAPKDATGTVPAATPGTPGAAPAAGGAP